MITTELINKSWGWAFDRPISGILKISKFANVLVIVNETVFRIIPEDLEVVKLCGINDIEKVINDELFIEDWEMEAWVTAIEGFLGKLPKNKVMAFKIPRVLGGEDEIKNIYFANIDDYLGGMGQIASQIKDLPNGAQLVIKPQ